MNEQKCAGVVREYINIRQLRTNWKNKMSKAIARERETSQWQLSAAAVAAASMESQWAETYILYGHSTL